MAIALSIVLFRYKRKHRSHFDLEQPRGSAMMKAPGMSEILEHTLWNEFDMCRVGGLKDPTTSEAIRKRMTVCSTSLDLHTALDGKLCQGEHHHRVIAGNTKINGQTIKMPKLTELYPVKFTRQVAKIMLHDQGQLCSAYAGEVEEHPTKKRRLGQKLSPQAIADRYPDPSDATWQNAMRCADQLAPRVGTHVIEQGDLMELLQKLCLHHDIRHVVLCRGTDRYVGPCKHVPKGSAPLRRQICIQRKTEEIHTDEWEPWEHLSQRGLRKKGTSARVSMTIFAAARDTSVPMPSRSERMPAASEMPAHSYRRVLRETEDEHIEPFAKRHCPEVSESRPVSQSPQTSNPNQEDNHNNQDASRHDTSHHNHEDTNHDQSIPQQVIDLASQKHGPTFLKLSSEEQANSISIISWIKALCSTLLLLHQHMPPNMHAEHCTLDGSIGPDLLELNSTPRSSVTICRDIVSNAVRVLLRPTGRMPGQSVMEVSYK